MVGDISSRRRVSRKTFSTKISKRCVRTRERRSSSKQRNRQGGVFDELPLSILERKISSQANMLDNTQANMLDTKPQFCEGGIYPRSYTEINYKNGGIVLNNNGIYPRSNTQSRYKNSEIGLNNNCKTTLPRRKDVLELEATAVLESSFSDDEHDYLETEDLNVTDRFIEIENDTERIRQNNVNNVNNDNNVKEGKCARNCKKEETNTDKTHKNNDNAHEQFSENIYQNTGNIIRREMSVDGYDLPPIRSVLGRDVNIGKLSIHLPYQARVKISRNELAVVEKDGTSWKITTGDGVDMFKSFSYVHSFHHHELKNI